MSRPRARPILHATDFSPASRPALARAMAWARRERAPLAVLHVLTPPSPFVNEARPPASYLELLEGARRQARARLAGLVRRARRGGMRVRGRIVEGAPAGEIVRAARRERARAIVIGTHGRSGLRRVLMGSVAERVLSAAGCPVLTVRAGPAAVGPVAPIRHVGILTGGGDCPGMNAAVRAVVKAAAGGGIQVTGFLDGFAGLAEDRARPLGWDDVSGILVQGGTLLGANNRYDPFRAPVPGGAPGRHADRSADVLAALERRAVDALIAIGGDGTFRIARRLAGLGVPVVGLPKTIDNDVAGTEMSVGFDSARAIATEAVDRVHTTAASHHRVLVVEVMGRHAGWIALDAGLAGGADVILIPEIPFRYEAVARAVRAREARGRGFSIVVVAEGARCPGGDVVARQIVPGSPEPVRLGGVGAVAAHHLEPLLAAEVRYVVLGHVQRGGPPTAFDRILATRLGVAAVEAAVDGAWGTTVALQGDRIVRVPLARAEESKLVDPAGDRVQAARAVRVAFGDEP